MQTIYVTDNGLQLKRRSNRIVLKKDGKVTEEIPILDLKRILIFGNNQLSTELIRYLAGKGVEIAFLSTHGRFKFRIVPETSKNIYLRMAQHDCYRDNDYRVRMSRTVVAGKLRNQRSLLLRSQRNRPDLGLDNPIKMLHSYMQQVNDKTSVEEVMGMEGNGSRVYFDGFGKVLLGGFEFVKREYYPAPDPVNALLSFGYMLLFNELSSILEASGFDVFLGFLHSTRYGRASLATDMIEEFRSPVIDRLVIYLINKGVIKPTQFGAEEGKKGVRMDEAARTAFLGNYEKFMMASFQDQKDSRQRNFRDIIKDQVMVFERSLLNRIDYKPYIFYS
jgi:CRISP-associated protein Cas1